MGTMASKYGHRSGDISSFYGAAQRISCRNRPFYDLPMWVNGKTADLADKNAIPGRLQSPAGGTSGAAGLASGGGAQGRGDASNGQTKTVAYRGAHRPAQRGRCFVLAAYRYL